MSPGYEARAEKALRMLREVNGDDLVSAEARRNYQKCHEFLLSCNDDYDVAVERMREWYARRFPCD